MSDRYILDGRTPILCDSTIKWALWMEIGNRRAALDGVKGYRVSTVFLGINHSFSLEQAPVLFETMVFNGDNSLEEYCMRYSTYDEAEAGHRAVVELIKALE